MAIYKRGGTYWYQFQFNGERIQESAQTGNKDAARQIEAAHRELLADGGRTFGLELLGEMKRLIT